MSGYAAGKMLDFIRNESTIIKDINEAESLEKEVLKGENSEHKSDFNPINNPKLLLEKKDKRIIKLLKKCFKET